MKTDNITDIREVKLQSMQHGIQQVQDRLRNMRADLLAEFAKVKLGIVHPDELVEITALAHARMQTHKPAIKLGRPSNGTHGKTEIKTEIKAETAPVILKEVKAPKAAKRRGRTEITPELRHRVFQHLAEHPTVSDGQLSKTFGFSDTTAGRLRKQFKITS